MVVGAAPRGCPPRCPPPASASRPEILPLSRGDRHLVIASTVPRITRALAAQLAPLREAAPHPDAAWLQVEARDGRYAVRQDARLVGTSECWLETTDLIRREVRQRLIADRPGLLWLHAGAAVRDGVAVLIVGGPGRGKSTLVTGLYRHGWRYLSDDLIAIDPATDRVHAVPETPSFRQGPGHRIPDDEIDTLPKATVEVAATRICREAVPIGAIIFPGYQPTGPTELISRRPGAAALGLFEHCLALSTHHRIAVPYLASLARRFPAFDLPYADGGRAAELVVRQRERG